MFLDMSLHSIVRCLALAGALAISSTDSEAQEQVTLHYAPKVASPAYASMGPVVAVDAGHHNFHRLDGRYAPFGALVAADGYRVKPFETAFSDETLRGAHILVVANALPASGQHRCFHCSRGRIPHDVGARRWITFANRTSYPVRLRCRAAREGLWCGYGSGLRRRRPRRTGDCQYSVYRGSTRQSSDCHRSNV